MIWFKNSIRGHRAVKKLTYFLIFCVSVLGFKQITHASSTSSKVSDVYQIISPNFSPTKVSDGQTSLLTVNYQATDYAKLTGLGLRLFYDSSALEMGDYTDRLRESAQPFQIVDDSNNLDGDPNTDKYFLTSWADISGDGWPYDAAQPAVLYKVPMTARTGFNGSTINFGYSSLSNGYTFKDNSALALMDVDGDGFFTPLTDGLLILRYMFGLSGDSLVNGLVSDSATRTSAAEIESFLSNLGSNLDIDGNGSIDALTDGLLSLRYMFGYEGDTLISGVISSNATLTSATELQSQLGSLTSTKKLGLISSGAKPKQTITASGSLSSLVGGQSTVLTIAYQAAGDAKLSGLGLRLHYDSSAFEMGNYTDRLTDGAQPFEIMDDTANFDDNSATDKYFLTSWADTSGDGWPNDVSQPATLYKVPLIAASDFNGSTINFSSAGTAAGHEFSASSVALNLRVNSAPVISAPSDRVVEAVSAQGISASNSTISAFLEEATAFDSEDGTLSVTTDAPSTFPLGTTTVTFSATDSAGATGAATATLTVRDTTGPTITPPSDLTIYGNSDGVAISATEIVEFLNDVSATDKVDGSISTITNDAPDVFPLGTTSVTFQASDVLGNVGSATALVIVTKSAQIITTSLSTSELSAGITTNLTVKYQATEDAKLVGLGLRLHYDSSVLEMGDYTDRLRESAQPFQIKDDTSDFDGDAATDKYLLTSWADTSGDGWPYDATQPVTLYVVPLMALSGFSGSTLNFTASSNAAGYLLSANNVTINKIPGTVSTLLELAASYTSVSPAIPIAGDWKLAPIAGALGVGWDADNANGWWSSTENMITDRACIFDDIYRLSSDGTFTNLMGNLTWLESWQGSDPEACATPVAPHNGSVPATYIYDATASTITVNGLGAHIGLPKVHNNGELSASEDAVTAITYTISELAPDGMSMTLQVNYSGSAVWQFKLVKLENTLDAGEVISFNSEVVGYSLADFGGNTSTLVADPEDVTNTVVSVIKGGETWAGTLVASGQVVYPLTAGATDISARIWSPEAGVTIRMKLEESGDNNHTVETDAVTTKADEWETLVFDFSNHVADTPALNTAYVFDKLSLFFNFGNVGTSETYYFDDIKFIGPDEIIGQGEISSTTDFSLTPAFSSDLTLYRATIPVSVQSVTMVPTLTDSFASISEYTINGSAVSGNTFDLAQGANNIRIKVLAEDGVGTTTYSVFINGDSDGDGVLDINDTFPLDATESLDTDSDGIGNNADTDDDDDGIADSSDTFPLDPAESVDTDSDGTGNNADPDDDNDGSADQFDAFPLDSSEISDNDSDGIGDNADNDDDNDGMLDASDVFPNINYGSSLIDSDLDSSKFGVIGFESSAVDDPSIVLGYTQNSFSLDSLGFYLQSGRSTTLGVWSKVDRGYVLSETVDSQAFLIFDETRQYQNIDWSGLGISPGDPLPSSPSNQLAVAYKTTHRFAVIEKEPDTWTLAYQSVVRMYDANNVDSIALDKSLPISVVESNISSYKIIAPDRDIVSFSSEELVGTWMIGGINEDDMTLAPHCAEENNGGKTCSDLVSLDADGSGSTLRSERALTWKVLENGSLRLNFSDNGTVFTLYRITKDTETSSTLVSGVANGKYFARMQLMVKRQDATPQISDLLTDKYLLSGFYVTESSRVRSSVDDKLIQFFGFLLNGDNTGNRISSGPIQSETINDQEVTTDIDIYLRDLTWTYSDGRLVSETCMSSVIDGVCQRKQRRTWDLVLITDTRMYVSETISYEIDDDLDGIVDSISYLISRPNFYELATYFDPNDADRDGVPNDEDLFSADPLDWADSDGDGIGNNADTDDDGDGVPDTQDTFPLDPSESIDTDSDGIGNNADFDDDNDGVADNTYSGSIGLSIYPEGNLAPLWLSFKITTSEDIESASLIGDWKISQTEGLGLGFYPGDYSVFDSGPPILDSTNSCGYDDIYRFGKDSSFSNIQGSETFINDWQSGNDTGGGSCGIPVAPHDGSIPATFIYNETSSTLTLDGLGAYLFSPAYANGLILTSPSMAPESITYEVFNLSFTETGVLDVFPFDATESVDSDADGIGNNADIDDDNDGVPDTDDAFPLDATESLDTDSDGIGNNADNDDDGDGTLDLMDAFPLDVLDYLDTDGDGIGNNQDDDDDGDGILDSEDLFPQTKYLKAILPSDLSLSPFGVTRVVPSVVDDPSTHIVSVSESFKLDDLGTFSQSSQLTNLGNWSLLGNGYELTDPTDSFLSGTIGSLGVTNINWSYVIANGILSESEFQFLTKASHKFGVIEKKPDTWRLAYSTVQRTFASSGIAIDSALPIKIDFSEIAEFEILAPTREIIGFSKEEIIGTWAIGGIGEGDASLTDHCPTDYSGNDPFRCGDVVALDSDGSGQGNLSGRSLKWSLSGNGGLRIIFDDNGAIFNLLRVATESFGFAVHVSGISNGKYFGQMQWMYKKPDASVALANLPLDKYLNQGFYVTSPETKRSVTDNRPIDFFGFYLSANGRSTRVSVAQALIDNDMYFQENEVTWTYSDGKIVSELCYPGTTLQVNGQDICGYRQIREWDVLEVTSNRIYVMETVRLLVDGYFIGLEENGGISEHVYYSWNNPQFYEWHPSFNLSDIDRDGVNNDDDVFPYESTESLDFDGDGVGDNADTDADNDGVLDNDDEFPLDPNETLDTDNDGVGNGEDSDDDNDGVSDTWTIAQLGSDIDGDSCDIAGRLALSGDGTVLAVGSWGANSYTGLVRIFKWNTSSGDWVQRGSAILGNDPYDYTGYSISLSDDGSVVAIDSSGGTPSNEAGYVRVYFWDGQDWAQRGNNITGESAGDACCYLSLSADGATIALGAQRSSGSSDLVDSGQARAFSWDGANWIQKGSSIDGEAADDRSGRWATSISSDGSSVAIGARMNDGNGSESGHVRVYKWINGDWVQRGEDIDGESAGDLSGNSVSLSSNGDLVAIGAPGNDGVGEGAGHVRVFRWSDTTSSWIQRGQDIDGQQSICVSGANYTDSDGDGITDTCGEESGWASHLSDDGSTLAIGAWKNDDNGTDSGQTRIYGWDMPSQLWVQRANGINGRVEGDHSGYQTSVSSDGSVIATGAWGTKGGEVSGYIRVFSLTSPNDVFPLDATESIDTDSDGIGNNADTDDDGDSVLDGDDAFPLDATESIDTDADGIGNNADTDDDNDGVPDVNDSLPLDPSNDSDGDGIPNNGDAYPENSLYTKDSDQDGMPDAWETLYGLDPNNPEDASSDRDNDGVSALDEFLAGTIPSGSIDLDGNEKYDALTDGLLLLRGMFGLDGSSLVTGTLASDAVYTDSVDIEARIEILGDLLDIDGNGQIDALSDGLLTLRYLFGLEGDTLINGVLAGDATRTSAEEIEAYIETLMPAL